MVLRFLSVIALILAIFSSTNIYAATCAGTGGVFASIRQQSFLYPKDLMISFYTQLKGKYPGSVTHSIRVLNTRANFEGRRVTLTEEFTAKTVDGKMSYSRPFSAYYYEDKTGLYKKDRTSKGWELQIDYGDENLRAVTGPTVSLPGGTYSNGKLNAAGKTYEGTLYVKVDTLGDLTITNYYLTGLGLIGFERSNGESMGITR